MNTVVLDVQYGAMACQVVSDGMIICGGEAGEGVLLWSGEEFARVVAERRRLGRILTIDEAERAAKGEPYTFDTNSSERFTWGLAPNCGQ